MQHIFGLALIIESVHNWSAICIEWFKKSVCINLQIHICEFIYTDFFKIIMHTDVLKVLLFYSRVTDAIVYNVLFLVIHY